MEKRTSLTIFSVVVQLIHRLTQTDISCTTTACLFFFPLLEHDLWIDLKSSWIINHNLPKPRFRRVIETQSRFWSALRFGKKLPDSFQDLKAQMGSIVKEKTSEDRKSVFTVQGRHPFSKACQ